MVIFDEPAIAILGIGGILFLLAGAILTIRRSRPAVARWALLVGLVLVAGTIAYGVFVAWSEPVG